MDFESSHREHSGTETIDQIKKRNSLFVILRRVIFIIALCTVILLTYFNSNNNYESTVVTIEKGASAASVASIIAESGVVRTETLLYAALVGVGNPSTIKAGSYIFEEGLSTYEIAKLIYQQVPQDPLISITLPEGITAQEMGALFASKLPEFDVDEFLNLSANDEGYLWPETYFVTETFTARDAYELLKETAVTEQANLFSNSDTSLTDEEVVILASIVEREANTAESMRMVAGILLNRLEISMPLQADATVEYVLDDKIGALPPGQLAEYLETLDSPYNSYLYPGLPPTPIGNPGADALQAVLRPAETSDLYYITDDEGQFHYAETYEEHVNNVERYLR
jgi:UPF0755 protein